jgi:hypothetical protein
MSIHLIAVFMIGNKKEITIFQSLQSNFLPRNMVVGTLINVGLRKISDFNTIESKKIEIMQVTSYFYSSEH